MKYFTSLIFVLTLLLFNSCSGISMLGGGQKSDLYSEKFLADVQLVKESYRKGESKKALTLLQQMNQEILLPTEKGFRRNLIGVIYFSEGNFEQAVFNFDQALATSRLDDSLTSQIYLNLAGSYFKLGFNEKAYASIISGKPEFLQDKEREKYFKLRFKLAQELGNENDIIYSLINFLGPKSTINELKSNSYYETMLSKYLRLSSSEKIKILEEFEESGFLLVGYLAYIEAEKYYYSGSKGEANDVLYWVKKHFGQHQEVITLVDNFTNRVENYARLEINNIGVVLPLSGKNKVYGERALLGIDSALKKYQEDNGGTSLPYKLFVKDSEASGVVGAHAVKELIDKQFVSVVIGGLFSSESLEEYREARSKGVIFISLSQVYLPRQEKDHLLIEIPGSIESQVAELFTDQMINHFGKRSAIIYPENSKGKAYVDEFWRVAKTKGVEINNVMSFRDEKIKDFRDPVSKLLGLKYTRMRQEEYDLMQEVYDLEKRRSIRRVQVLKPDVDFDWVFVPVKPLNAQQIIPSFTYFDVSSKLPIIGDASWRSNSLSRASEKFRNIYFVGDDVTNISSQFTQWFYNKYNQPPRLIELRGHDSVVVLKNILSDLNVTNRNDLDILLRSRKEVYGLTGKWSQDEGVWLKKLIGHHLKRGKIIKVRDEIAAKTMDN
ncbi:ABC transporter substrate-binding protein [Bacteriovoracaceae bacterium]|nr:ABC transporter substrate-binding protein [Bacteriovoracaceae bacterium]